MSEVKKLVTRYSRDFSGNMQVDPNGSWVLAADASIHAKRLTDKIDSTQSELTALREELAVAKHDIASFLETTAKVCDLLGIDTEDAKHAEGNPSDVFFSHATALSKRLAAAEQRNSDLVALLECVNDTGELTRPEHEDLEADICSAVKDFWDRRRNAKPTESGASEEDEQDAKTVFIRSNTKQGQNISMADMKVRYEDKP